MNDAKVLPDRYWETHWEVAAWNTSIDEPFVEFFPTEDEARICAADLRAGGFDGVSVYPPVPAYPNT